MAPLIDVRARDADAERVAVGCRARDAADADAAGGATDVFDDDGLAERRPHALGQDARDRIERARRRGTARPS